MIVNRDDTWHPWNRALPKRKILYRRDWELHRHPDGTHIKRTTRRTWQQWALVQYRQARRAKRRQMRRASKRR